MAFDAGSITGGINFDVSQFTSGIQQATSGAQGFGQSVAAGIEAPLERVAGTFTSVSQGIAQALHFPTDGFAGSMMQVEALMQVLPSVVTEFMVNPLLAVIELVEKAIEATGKLAKAFADMVAGVGERFQKVGMESLKLGLDPQTFSTFAAAAKAAGVDVQQFSNALKFMEDRAAGAVRGERSGAKAFADLGISAQQLGTLLNNPRQLLLAVADAMQQIHNPAQRVQAAMELMSRAGTDMIPFLEQGSDEIVRMADEMGKLGGGVNEAQVKLGQSWKMLGTMIGAMWDGLKAKLAEPILQFFEDHLTEIIPKLEEFADWMGKEIPAAMTFLGGLATSLFEVMEPLGELLGIVFVPVLEVIEQWLKRIAETMRAIADLSSLMTNGIEGLAKMMMFDAPGADEAFGRAGSAFHRLKQDFGAEPSVSVGPVNVTFDSHAATSEVAAKLHPAILKGYDQLHKQYVAATTTHKVSHAMGGRSSGIHR
ncbi:MAG TPA: methyl-accepting chemotaxis protein [Tepidisphaeraceae bacterium]|nr:methyl-accepting chemotaxis protein [Tepidisphaeraceae bacterium]